MIKDLLGMFQKFEQERAPKTLPRSLSPYFYRPSQVQNLDVDYVQGAIQTALQGDMTPLLGLYRDIEVSDGTIQSAISTRKLAVLSRGYNVLAVPNSGAAGKSSADQALAMLDRSANFVDACTWWLHGCIWPTSLVERRWIPGGTGDFDHADFRPVPLELLDYRTRRLRIRDTDELGNLLATSHVPMGNRYVQHKGHMLMAPDNWGGPMRALVFWFLFSVQDREWWARYLERFGSPFLVGYFDRNDDESRANLERAFQEATRIFGIVATKETQVTVQGASNTSGGGEAFQAFYDCAQREKLLLILGQTLSGQAQGTGMGSGVANLQSNVKEDVKAWDAFKLSMTVRNQVIAPWMALNGIKGPVPMPVFGGFSPDALVSIGGFLESLSKGGLELEDDSIDVLSRYSGLTLRRAAKPPPPTFAAPGLPFPPRPGADAPPKPGDALAAASLPPSAIANEAVVDHATGDLAAAWSGELAPLGEIIRTSRDRNEVLKRAGAFLTRYRPHDSAQLITAVLEAHAANALLRLP